MTKATPRVLLLETQLDEGLDAGRSQARFMREFFKNLPHLEFISREVHSRADLAKFLTMARDDGTVRAIHLIAHGAPEMNRSRIVLTQNEFVDLDDLKNRRLFRSLGVDLLLLSCCGLGANEGLMRKLVKTSGAQVAFSYTRDVEDYQAFVIESLLFHLAYGTFHGAPAELGWPEVYRRLLSASEILGLDGDGTVSEPLFVAHFGDIPVPIPAAR